MTIKNLIIFLLILLIATVGTIFLSGSDKDTLNLLNINLPQSSFLTYKKPSIITMENPYEWEDSFQLIVFTSSLKGVIINGDTIKYIKGNIIILLENKDGNEERYILMGKNKSK